MKVLTNLDLVKNQLLNALAQKLAVDPSTSLEEAWITYNTTEHVLKYYNGTKWVPLTDAPEITVETSIDASSTNDNPVGPKAVYDAIIDAASLGQVLSIVSDGNEGKEVAGLAIDATATENSTNLISSGAVFDAVSGALATVLEDPADGEILVKKVITDPDTGEVTSVTTEGLAIDSTIDVSATGVPTTAAVASAIAAIQSMEFVGTVASDGTVTSSDPAIDGQILMDLTEFKKGWTFVVSGTLEAATSGFPTTLTSGDMIIALANDTQFTPANFSLVQKNMDGVVMGPNSATDGDIALFDGATGTLIKDSGVAISDLATSAQFDNPLLTSVSGQCAWTITHNKNSRAVSVKLYDSSWAEVLADVSLATVDTAVVTINSDTDIAANSYHAVVVG